MSRSDRSSAGLLLVLAVTLVALLGACGVDTGNSGALAAGSGSGTTTVPCKEDPGGGGTGGIIGSGDGDPACTPTSPTTAPGPTTTTRPPTTTEPDRTTTTTSGNGTEPDEQSYVDAMVESLGSPSDGDLLITRSQAECIGPQWVEIIGAQDMFDAGIEPDDLIGTDVTEQLKDVIDRSMADQLVSVMADCDFDTQNVIIDGIAKGADLTPDQADCFAGKIPDGFGERLLVVALDEGAQGLDNDPNLSKTLTDAADACT